MLNFHVVTARTELGSGGHVLFDKCVIVVVMEGALSVKEHAGLIARLAGRPCGKAGIAGVAEAGKVDPCGGHLVLQLFGYAGNAAVRSRMSVVENERNLGAVPRAGTFVNRKLEVEHIGVGSRFGALRFLRDKVLACLAEEAVEGDEIIDRFSRQICCHITGEEEAIRVISLKPPAAISFIFSSGVSIFCTAFTSVEAMICGRWLTAAVI